ncbi:hypothetical protein AX15_002853 [Amanita polypyramis BW_CC]|nr:hypothetical protein AX15_002853 [Amanita polypyramis BW_CC]
MNFAPDHIYKLSLIYSFGAHFDNAPPIVSTCRTLHLEDVERGTVLDSVYSAHIKHTIWIYLFFLPFQLVHDFGYYSIPGVAIASFIYLGFLAAGEEIEQPFGYDENDLDLDLFCQDIIHADMERLKTSPCLNARFGPWQSARAKRNIRPESHEAGTSAHYAVTVGVSETLAENE